MTERENMKNVTTLLLVVMILPAMAFGQFKSQPPTEKSSVGFRESLDGDNRSLIDFSKIKMSQSYSMSFSTYGGRGASLGLYQNTLSYKISDPLEVKLKIGLVNQFYNSNFNDGTNAPQVLYGTEINYQPSEKFQLHFEFGLLQ